MNKKILYGIVVLVVLIFGAWAIISNKPNTDEPVKIGVALPLTGPAAFLGESARNAAMLAVKDAGDTKYKYELVIEDDSFTPSKTATVANKFINIDKVLAFVTFGSGTSNAAAPIAEAAGVTRFGLASDPTSAEGKYNFIHWTPAFKEGELLAKEMVNRGYKNIAIVNANHPGTNAVADAIKSSLDNSSVNVVAYENTNVGDKDFRSTVIKLKQLNPDIVAVTLFSPEIEIFTKQAKELGLNSVLTCAETFEWSNEPELFEGYWFVGDALLPDSFIERYKNEYGDTPKAGASYVYDLVSMIISMQEKSNKRLSSSDVAELIAQTGEYNSPLFGNVKIDDDGLFITDASLKIMKDKQAVFVK